MNNLDSDSAIRSLRRSLPGVVAILLTACASGPDSDQSGAAAGAGTALPTGGHASTLADNVDQYILVDCLLPGQIRRLGTMMTYLSARRTVKTTQSDCAIRGGEYVLFDRSDYASALTTLLPKATAGDAVAQTYVGEIYEKGLGMAVPDYASAAQWYQKAAASNHAPAQTSLGSLYERGLGVPKDNLKALDLYRQAAGISEDTLIFESQLEQERAAFRQEIALRNRVAASLKQQLQATQSQLRRTASASPSADNTARVAALQRQLSEQERVLAIQRADAQAEAARLKQEAKAANSVLTAEQANAAGGSNPKVAQAGKLELVRREQYEAVLATSNKLAGPP